MYKKNNLALFQYTLSMLGLSRPHPLSHTSRSGSSALATAVETKKNFFFYLISINVSNVSISCHVAVDPCVLQ